MGDVKDVTCSKARLAQAFKRLENAEVIDENKNIIKKFIFSLRRAELRPNTLASYTNILLWMSQHLAAIGINKPLYEIHEEDFDALLMYFGDEKGYTPGGINQYKKSFKRFSRWYFEEEVPDGFPTSG